jgi:redox-sensitive bicupin YhaK (pirin superfamily)
MSIRPVIETRRAEPHIEGAGVHLHRAFGFRDPSELDPFLMFDDFRGDHPRDYSAGFPWHPHRGIETITYVLAGTVEHGDSLGNKGTLGPGSLQLMTAGRGILHQEMPKGDKLGRMHGFQLWGNLPKALKMTAPRYQDMPSEALPERHEDDGTSIRVVIGDYRGVKSPVDGIAADPQYLDIFVPAGKRKSFIRRGSAHRRRQRRLAHGFEKVGWAWQVSATSCAEAPNSIATQTSWINSPAPGPMIWQPECGRCPCRPEASRSPRPGTPPWRGRCP